MLPQHDMESSGGFKIDKLNDNNYHTWKRKIELLLAFRDQDEAVSEAPPADMEHNLEAATLFKKKDSKAQAVIRLTLPRWAGNTASFDDGGSANSATQTLSSLCLQPFP
jgi:hypothetical protein